VRPQVTFRGPLTFAAGGEVFEMPMIDARIGDVRTKLVVDTGATDHLLTIDVAHQAKLPTRPGEPGTDTSGGAVESWDVGDVAVELAGRPIVLHGAVAITGPPPFEAWGIGGFLSPQHAQPSAFIVLDLVTDELVLLEGTDESVFAWLDSTYPLLQPVEASRDTSGVITVRAAIVPFEKRVMIIDTGDATTEIVASAVPGLAASPPTASGYAAGGADVTSIEVKGQTLEAGGASFVVPVLGVRDIPIPKDFAGPEPPAGVLGMDVLKGTVVALGRGTSHRARWLVPR
jgi:hypothetical protein